jgi:HK97 family phage major capsid protein
MNDPVVLAAVRRARAALDIVGPVKDPPRFSLARAVSGMAFGRLDGYERECLEESARSAGAGFDAQRVRLPWHLLRDLTVSPATSGGYLVQTDVPPAVDILRRWSITGRAGITVITGLQGSQGIVRTTTRATTGWLSSESATLPSSTPAIDQSVVTPKMGGAFLKYSRQFGLQTTDQQFAGRELAGSVGELVDQAILNGSGATGEPRGVLNTAGVQTQSGTTLGWSGVTNMKEQCFTNNAPSDGTFAFISTPAVRELLENRERVSTSGRFVWEDDRTASAPAYATAAMPSATMIAASWSDIVLAFWGDDIQLEINPADPTDFKTGVIQARVIVACDVVVLHPAAICTSTSIT